MRLCRLAGILALTVLAASCLIGAEVAEGSRARAIADEVMQRLGGADAWAATRFVQWKFFGGRQHYWDRHTGDVRIEFPERKKEDGSLDRPELLVLMNIDTRQGRVWAAGEEVAPGAKLEEYLTLGHKVWINDSYWMFMPYKLLDPGVTLNHTGERALEDGRPADVLDMTFAESAGYTPKNRYEVFVARDSGLIEQWAFYRDASDEEPSFTMPWTGWKKFGEIWLATDHGEGQDWAISVDPLPRSIFTE